MCSDCPVAVDAQALGEQAVRLLAPILFRFEGECRCDIDRALVVMTAVFAALPECRGLCFRCGLERAESVPVPRCLRCGELDPLAVGAVGDCTACFNKPWSEILTERLLESMRDAAPEGST